MNFFDFFKKDLKRDNFEMYDAIKYNKRFFDNFLNLFLGRLCGD